MLLSCVTARRARLALVAGLVGVVASVGGASDAEARRSKKRKATPPVSRQVYAPPFAAMIVDANTGRVLHAQNQNELRHPASVTKVMTLYMLFEQLERGKLSLDSGLKISRNAASQAPSKLGLSPGGTIEVEDAIKALVTKSANDVASAIAENLAASEEEFAEKMTRKARQLGMRQTVFKNASGLPDREQVTTARDLTILARAIQERFPKHYRYFQTRSFAYAGRVIGNHNRLLGRVEGVDGIKTGFTNASGFNLMTSARLDGRHVVGVVLGGRSGASRDTIMANLIRTNMGRAHAGRPTSSVLAEAGEGRVVASAESDLDVETTAAIPTASTAGASSLEAMRSAVAGVFGAATMPATFKPAANVQTSPSAAVSSESERIPSMPIPGQKIDARLPATFAAPARTEPPSRPVVVAARVEPSRAEAARAEPVRSETSRIEPARIDAARAETTRSEPKREAAKPASVTPWVIQLAAEENEQKAMGLLTDAKSRSGRALSRAEPFTEKIVRGSATLYRARFSGFGEAEAAQEACASLKRSGFACFATRS